MVSTWLKLLIGPIEVLKRKPLGDFEIVTELLIGPIEVLKFFSSFESKLSTINRTFMRIEIV